MDARLCFGLIACVASMASISCARDDGCLGEVLAKPGTERQEPQLELIACPLSARVSRDSPVMIMVGIANRGSEPVLVDGRLELYGAGGRLSAVVTGPAGAIESRAAHVDFHMRPEYTRVFIPGRGVFAKIVRLDCYAGDYLPGIRADEDETGCITPDYVFEELGTYTVALRFDSSSILWECTEHCPWEGRLTAAPFQIRVTD